MQDGEKIPPLIRATGFAVCTQCPALGRAPQAVPCVHQLGLQALAALYLSGMRRMVTATGPCDGCPSRPAATLADDVARLNLVLASRGLPQVKLRKATAGEQAYWRDHFLPDPAADPGRRGFLRRGAERLEQAVGEEAEPAPAALAALQSLPASQGRAVYAYVPIIDAAACTGCDACLRACPEEALILVKDDDHETCYQTLPEQCTGCGLCVELCDTNAIEIADMAPAPGPVPLRVLSCRACGVQTHEPAGQPNPDGLCRICRQTGHHKKLFQVLT